MIPNLMIFIDLLRFLTGPAAQCIDAANGMTPALEQKQNV